MGAFIIGLFTFIGVLAVILIIIKNAGVKDDNNNFIPDVVEEKVKEVEAKVVEKVKEVEAEVVAKVKKVTVKRKRNTEV